MPPRRKQTDFWCYCSQCGSSGMLRNEVDHLSHELELTKAANPHVWTTVEESNIAKSERSTPLLHPPDFEQRKRRRLENDLDLLVQKAKALEKECHEYRRVLINLHEGKPNSNVLIPVTYSVHGRQLLHQADFISKEASSLPTSYIGQHADNIAHILSQIRHLVSPKPGRGPILYDSCEWTIICSYDSVTQPFDQQSILITLSITGLLISNWKRMITLFSICSRMFLAETWMHILSYKGRSGIFVTTGTICHLQMLLGVVPRSNLHWQHSVQMLPGKSTKFARSVTCIIFCSKNLLKSILSTFEYVLTSISARFKWRLRRVVRPY